MFIRFCVLFSSIGSDTMGVLNSLHCLSSLSSFFTSKPQSNTITIFLYTFSKYIISSQFFNFLHIALQQPLLCSLVLHRDLPYCKLLAFLLINLLFSLPAGFDNHVASLNHKLNLIPFILIAQITSEKFSILTLQLN